MNGMPHGVNVVLTHLAHMQRELASAETDVLYVYERGYDFPDQLRNHDGDAFNAQLVGKLYASLYESVTNLANQIIRMQKAQEENEILLIKATEQNVALKREIALLKKMIAE